MIYVEKIVSFFLGYNDSRLFAELIRGSLLALYSVSQTSHESHWGAFTFLKVPHILSQLRGKTDNISAVNAIDLILQVYMLIF